MKPDVILFDEPMAALDAENRLTLRDEIKKLHNSPILALPSLSK